MEVVCAIIENEEGKLFAARRAPHKSLAGYWEFPGGKREEGESLEEALQRELREELKASLVIGPLIHKLSWENKRGAFELSAFAVKSPEQAFSLEDHDKQGWFKLDELLSLKLLPADVLLLKEWEKRTKKWS